MYAKKYTRQQAVLKASIARKTDNIPARFFTPTNTKKKITAIPTTDKPIKPAKPASKQLELFDKERSYIRTRLDDGDINMNLKKLGFVKLAEDDSIERATKVIKSRHSTPRVEGDHKQKVVGHVLTSYGNSPKKYPKFDAAHLLRELDAGRVTAFSDTSRHADQTIKEIKHTLAYVGKDNKMKTPTTTRKWNNTLTTGSGTKTTGASESAAARDHMKTVNRFFNSAKKR